MTYLTWNMPDTTATASTSSKDHPDDPRWKLRFSEMLSVYVSNVVLGRGIPDQFDAPPWRLPLSAHPKADLINTILDHSMTVQSSTVDRTVPNSKDFEEFILTNAQLVVSGLIRSYLHSVLDGKDKDMLAMEVTFGVLMLDPRATTASGDEHRGRPFLWLQVNGM